MRNNRDDLVEGLIRSEQMEETAAYLGRGRRFSALSPSELELRWVEAFRTWLGERTDSHLQQMDDLSAELRLRGLEPPYHLVKKESEAIREEIRVADPADFDIREKIAAYLRKLDEPDA